MRNGLQRCDDGVTTNSLSAVVFPIHNMYYPRNSRIRTFLECHGYRVTAINRGTATKSSKKGKALGVVNLFRSARGADVVILSEMSLKYAFLTYLASRINNAVHVVDGFIGLYETDIEDKKKYDPSSIRAWCLKKLDCVALWSADIYLIDTEIRGDVLKQLAASKTEVLSLPVGAPAWAKPLKKIDRANESKTAPKVRRILYYGNYIPLHGLKLFVEAWASVKDPSVFRVVFIGGGDCYVDVYNSIQKSGLSQYCKFYSSVPESDLQAYISETDVVLGIFGSSSKAQTVIANKVWQGLACGRPVLTGSSEALNEISLLVGSNLICVERDVQSVSQALDRIMANDPPEPDELIADKLEAYVDSKYGRFASVLEEKVFSRKTKTSD